VTGRPVATICRVPGGGPFRRPRGNGVIDEDW
jgi:hypothetical protein